MRVKRAGRWCLATAKGQLPLPRPLGATALGGCKRLDSQGVHCLAARCRKLRAPDLSTPFGFWEAEMLEGKRQLEKADLERQARSTALLKAGSSAFAL